MSVIFYSTIPSFEDYFQPKSIARAVSLLLKYGAEAKVLAGGTDLIPLMRVRTIQPKYIVDITRIAELDYIRYSRRDGLRIGALATLSAVQYSDLVKERYPLLYEAIHQMATTQVKNMGTVVGNICRASPSADTAPPLLVLEAEVKIVGSAETKVVPLDRFFKGPGETILKGGELVAEIRVPSLPASSGTAFLRATRTASDLAKVNVASIVTVRNGVILNTKIALGGVAPTPIRARKVEAALRGRELGDGVIEKAAEMVTSEIKPITDVRSTAEYRTELSKVLVRRALTISLARARNEVRR